MANRFREITEPQVEQDEQTVAEPVSASSPSQSAGKPRKKGVLAKFLSAIFSGTFLSNEKTFAHAPFILFVAALALLYITNGYYADDKVREFNKSTNQLKELRSEYISTKSELMFASKQSEVAKAVAADGLFEPVVPPKKIEADSAELYDGINDKVFGN